MTIQEAVKSGKRFRHPNWLVNVWDNGDMGNFGITREELLSNDWQIEREPDPIIMITRSDFYEAWKRTMEKYGRVEYASHLAKELSEKFALP